MLTVADALRQVLDIIELLDLSDTADAGAADETVWRLSYATTNSPFEIGAEATSKDPTLSVSAKARLTKVAVRAMLGELLGESVANERSNTLALGSKEEAVISRILARNLNGIGRTDLDFGDNITPATIVHANAAVAKNAIEKARLLRDSLKPDLTRTEYGSFEGEIVSAGMHHNNPATVIRHRLTGEKVTCVFPTEIAYRIGSQHNWHEVWAGKRVLVHGELHYNEDGDLKRVDALDIEMVEEHDVELSAARRIDLLSGLTVAEFLDRSWTAADGEG